MFVISIKILFDCSGNKLEKPEYEYFSYDKYAGSFSTGYPTWESFYSNCYKIRLIALAIR